LFAQLPDISYKVASKVYDKIYSEKQKRTIVLETRNARYHVVPEKESFGYYVAVGCGVHKFFVKEMPAREELENKVGLLEWVDLPFEDQDTDASD